VSRICCTVYGLQATVYHTEQTGPVSGYVLDHTPVAGQPQFCCRAGTPSIGSTKSRTVPDNSRTVYDRVVRFVVYKRYDPRMGGAIGVAGGGQLPPCALCPDPVAAPSRREKKNHTCALDPSRPLSQRKFYVKINEMCQNTAQSVLNFFLFPVANGQSTCC